MPSSPAHPGRPGSVTGTVAATTGSQGAASRSGVVVRRWHPARTHATTSIGPSPPPAARGTAPCAPPGSGGRCCPRGMPLLVEVPRAPDDETGPRRRAAPTARQLDRRGVVVDESLQPRGRAMARDYAPSPACRRPAHSCVTSSAGPCATQTPVMQPLPPAALDVAVDLTLGPAAAFGLGPRHNAALQGQRELVERTRVQWWTGHPSRLADPDKARSRCPPACRSAQWGRG